MIPARIAVGAAVAADDFDLHYFVDGPAAAGNAPAATEAHGQFLFNTTSNELFWDSNGTATGGTTLIATLNTALQATDFELRSGGLIRLTLSPKRASDGNLFFSFCCAIDQPCDLAP